jgi:hypothetical protein
VKRQLAKVQQIKAKIQTLIKLVGLGIKKYIVQLLDLEAKLEEGQKEQMKYTQEQIKAAFEKAGGNWREWNDDFYNLIPQLKGLNLSGDESSNLWFQRYPQVFQKFDDIGSSDWQIMLCIKTANAL